MNLSPQERLRDLEHHVKRLKERPSIKAANDTLDKMLELLRAIVNGEAHGS